MKLGQFVVSYARLIVKCCYKYNYIGFSRSVINMYQKVHILFSVQRPVSNVYKQFHTNLLPGILLFANLVERNFLCSIYMYTNN